MKPLLYLKCCSPTLHRLLTLCLLLTLWSCTAERITLPENTELQLPKGAVAFTINDAYKAQTRGLSEADENTVQDLYLFAFTADENMLLVTKKFYTRAEINEVPSDWPAIPSGHLPLGYVNFDLEPGTYYLMGVSNIAGSVLDYDLLLPQLEAVRTARDLLAIDVQLRKIDNSSDDSSNAQITRLNPSMAMVGGWKLMSNPSTNPNDMDVIEVGGNDTGLMGMLHMQRIDAHVTFKLYNELNRTQGDSTIVCDNLELISWQVMNVPFTNALAENVQASNPGQDAIHESYKDSKESIHFDVDLNPAPGTPQAAGMFDFYLMANHNPMNTPITTAQREERMENDHGKFKYAPAEATYVVLRAAARFTITNRQGETYHRQSEMEYTIHLGNTYVQGENPATADPKDFNVDRNTKYLYNVRLRGVNDIIVEALRQPTQYNHGVEGEVADVINGRIHDLDAHYNVFNVELTPDDISKMQVRAYSPVEGEQYFGANLGNVNSVDYQAIRFAPTTSMGVLANYSKTYDVVKFAQPRDVYEPLILTPDATHTVPLYDIQSFIERCGERDNFTKKYYTVFVGENVYPGHEWHEYTNKDPRSWMLFPARHISTDNNSVYTYARYILNQRSIQTFANSGVTDRVIGIEHKNEHQGLKLWENHGRFPTQSRKETSSGHWAAAKKLLSEEPVITGRERRWDVMANPTKPLAGQNTFTTGLALPTNAWPSVLTRQGGDLYDAMLTALARNRDLNRDGVINVCQQGEYNELRWFVPNINQYVAIQLGRAALTTPLFIPQYEQEYGGSPLIDDDLCKFHFFAANGQMLWSEETLSVGKYINNSAKLRTYAHQVRCMRYLNVLSDDYQNIPNIPNQANYAENEIYYKFNTADNTINALAIDERCIRAYSAGHLAISHCFDNTFNTPYRKFKVASFKIQNDNYNVGLFNSQVNTGKWGHNQASITAMEDVRTAMTLNELCREYYEEPDQSDKGKWRLPNQAELAMLFYSAAGITGIPGADKNIAKVVSSTTWYPTYTNGNYRFMVINNNILSMTDPSANGNPLNKMYILPVRDIE